MADDGHPCPMCSKRTVSIARNGRKSCSNCGWSHTPDTPTTQSGITDY